MKGINPKIIEKIMKEVGDDAPIELKDFFEQILLLEAKNETTRYEPSEMASNYQTLLAKFSKNEQIIEFLGGTPSNG